MKAASDEEQLHQLFRIEGRGVGRHHAEDRLHEAAHGLHGLAEFVVGFGVEFRVAGNLAVRLAMIVHAPQVVAAGHRRERAIERKDLEAVARQVEIADDLGSQQRHHVRAHRKLEPRKDFLGDGGAAEHMPSFEHENLLACFRKIRGVDQPVVAAADYDDVVFGH